MKLFIDDDFKCHASNPEGAYTEAETDIFNGMCKEYIEGFRFVPSGKTWVRFDGVAFEGEMICAWRDWQELDAEQRDYEREQLATLQAENAALVADMAQMVEEIYQSDTEMMGL